MAKKVYDEKIDKRTDWGGDESTGGLKVSGSRVQEFIKETFERKVGTFYYDDTNNRYLVFADEDARDEYIDNPTQVDLILGSFDAPFNYSAEIRLTTPTHNTILLGTKNNYIDFTFDTYNKQGQSVGEDVICNYTFIRGSNKKVVSEKYRHGATVHFNIDDYISEGTNSITVAIVGQNTLAATTVGITFQVVNLKLSDTYEVSNVYDLTINPSASAAIQYTVDGYGTKIIEWYLDGVLLDFVKGEDEIVEVSTSRTKYIDLSTANQGVHRLQYRAYIMINGEKFYSNILHRDLIVYTKSDIKPMIAIAAEIPFEYGLDFSEIITLNNLTQYIPFDLRFSVFNPANPATTETTFTLEGEVVSRMQTKNREEFLFNLRPPYYGLKTLVISAASASRTISLNIKKSNTSLEEITDGLQLDLLSLGKTNDDVDRDIWNYGQYRTAFENFNWNQASGWNEGRLVIPSTSSIEVSISPLESDSTATGKTIEIEFATANVSDESAVICDLRGANGAGILITASEAKLISAGKSEVNTKFKSEESNRISFVINRKTGVVNKGLVFIYINGVLSGAQTYSSTDNFLSSKALKIGGNPGADIKLKALRFYNAALNSNQILNNYMLYRDTTNEMLSVYDKNDIYETGTQNFSVDKLSAQIPVMIVTGDIPTLENTNDKNETIYVDIQYINMQDRTKSFTSKGTRMRPQGTSSMGYPKKNFRIYTNYGEMYDYNGAIIPGGNYAMRDDSQPVNCWCFKADYAESSGTHNTGIARLWNSIMFGAQVNGEYVLRTEAQKAALANNFNFDVRTTVDGFPMLMFYRLTAQDDLIFIGKYNFNNDKSTESVFGFRDIPGFDNTNMQCLEILNNGNKHALFQTMEGFDEEWEEAYEFRYNEKKPDIRQIKDFSMWCVSTRHSADTSYSGNITINAELRPEKNGTYPDNAANRQLKFEMEKWDRLDVHKVAAYYIYLMRFGAVDQVVKNAMFTTEGTQGKGTKAKWFFINYDNDTINGVRNDGLLKYSWNIDRQSIDDSYVGTVYAYAGHESTLWNNLEADAEFMSLVTDVDNALFISGLSYAKTIEMFNVEQSAKWNERVYNQDAQYKYIGPYNDMGTNNLFMLQGTRSAHRKWWLSNRFDLIDSKHVSGAYKSKMIELKIANAPAGLRIGITSGKKLYYGYGLNNVPIETGIELSSGQSYNFITKQVINVGDPIRIYSAVNVQGLDLSGLAPYLSTINLTEVWNETSGTKLKSLILGGSGVVNTSLNLISGLSQAKRLELLNIVGYKSLYDIPLEGLIYLKTFQAYGSGLTSVNFPEGSLIETAQLPSGLKGLVLDNLPYLQTNNFSVESGGPNIESIFIRNCVQFNAFNFLKNWYANKVATDDMVSLEVWDINWIDVPTADILKLGNIKTAGGTLSLNGKIRINDFTLENYSKLTNLFGLGISDPKNSLYIYGQGGGVYLLAEITDPNKYFGGNTYDFTHISFIEGIERVEFMFLNKTTNAEFQSDDYVSMDRLTGRMTTKETLISRAYRVAVKVYDGEGRFWSATFDFNLGLRAYPSELYITGEQSIKQIGNYLYNIHVGSWTVPLVQDTGNSNKGLWNLTWGISGDLITSGEATVVSSGNDGLLVNVNIISPDSNSADISLDVKRISDNVSVKTSSLTIGTMIRGVIFTKKTQPELMRLFYAGGYAASPDFMTESEAFNVRTLPTNFFQNNLLIFTFNEFVYFENLTDFNFKGCTKLRGITLPSSLTVLTAECFYTCLSLIKINLENIVKYPSHCFAESGLSGDLTFPEGVPIFLGVAAFKNTKITSVKLPPLVSTQYYYREQIFYGCRTLVTVDFSNISPLPIESSAFSQCVSLTNLIGSDNLVELRESCFAGCTSLPSIISLKGIVKFGISPFQNSSIEEVILSKQFNIDNQSNFTRNSNISRITVEDGENVIKSVDGVLFSADGTTIYVYPNKKITGDKKYTIPTGTIKVQSYCFHENSFLEEVIFPEGIKEIGIYAFNRTVLKTVTLPSSLVTLGASSFANSRGITTFTINSQIANLLDDTFQYCSGMGNIIFANPGSIKTISKGCFTGCSSLTTFPPFPNCTTMGGSCFANCSSLQTVVLPEGLTSLGTYAFSNCVNLINFTFPSTLDRIGAGVLGGTPNMKNIYFLREVSPTISFDAFGANNLRSFCGYNTKNDAITNKAYLKTNATGYTEGEGYSLANIVVTSKFEILKTL